MKNKRDEKMSIERKMSSHGGSFKILIHFQTFPNLSERQCDTDSKEQTYIGREKTIHPATEVQDVCQTRKLSP